MKKRMGKKCGSIMLAFWMVCSTFVPEVSEGLSGEQTETYIKVEAAAQGNMQSGSAEYEYLDTVQEVQSFWRTKISWKKKKVDRYIIYQVMKGGVKRKKIAVISGDKTSYVVKTKKNRYYSLEIRGKRYKKGTKTPVFACVGQPSFYSGIMPVGFGDYTWAEGFTSTKKIALDFYANDGIKPDGILFYRKERGEKKFRIVGKRKWSKIRNSWTDKKVKARRKYIYKMRTYKNIGGTRYYGPYSGKISKNSVNMYGSFKVSGNPEGSAPVLKITGDKNNGVLTFYSSYFLDCVYFSKKEETFWYRVIGFSLDGKKWMTKENVKDFPKQSSFEGTKGFWLRFEKEERVEDEDDIFDLENEYELSQSVSYNGVPSFLIISPYGKRGCTMEDSEAVH